ncbi:hypothetical protein Terro_0360 [Terriglobus roseus DSM 18391]|uniref:Uncharacterized protein n=1 Tax=Terriglobus roseus (strain DSM 18391 / NRRL B-41598 / KBS 63) TaxID=926566 RepID=I3ZBU1_TERRK|nr:hypothetical protein [Terriglobus roseus]AFL86709.1 hypothetical protein Terro_0360 [Terriglobus roseus DSM 18391]
MRPDHTRPEQPELTAGERAGAMLIVAAIVLPVLCGLAIVVTKHFLWVHYNTHTVTLWLVLDAAILIAGVLLRGEQHP